MGEINSVDGGGVSLDLRNRPQNQGSPQPGVNMGDGSFGAGLADSALALLNSMKGPAPTAPAGKILSPAPNTTPPVK